jgi:signal transduction histidine kinase
VGIPEVHCDPEQLKQVLLNLVINGIQASQPGTNVTIATSRNSHVVSICVEDQGCAVEEQQLQHIFEPFFTTKQGGTGLGLAIASMIVGQHGGWLTAAKNPSQGMTFRVDLPCGENQAS